MPDLLASCSKNKDSLKSQVLMAFLLSANVFHLMDFAIQVRVISWIVADCLLQIDFRGLSESLHCDRNPFVLQPLRDSRIARFQPSEYDLELHIDCPTSCQSLSVQFDS